MKQKVFEIICLLGIIIVLVIVSNQWVNCSKCGGEFVRGVVWFKCIGGGE